jgi:deazaflavin-dependent oxidoreductase (nitroreductase family)
VTARARRIQPFSRVKRWIYRGDRPSGVARVLNRFWARQYGSGRLARARDVTLEVRGRSSGKTIVLPVVLADYQGEWYLVSMLGENANWVRNVRAADGRAVIRHGTTHDVELHEVPVGRRAPILQRYLDVAPGARPHVPIDRTAPAEDFERIAHDFPAFRVVGRGDAKPT